MATTERGWLWVGLFIEGHGQSTQETFDWVSSTVKTVTYLGVFVVLTLSAG